MEGSTGNTSGGTHSSTATISLPQYAANSAISTGNRGPANNFGSRDELDEISQIVNTSIHSGVQNTTGDSLTRSGRSNSSSVSELSVACLQDRIIQMEESHHCTNEELQATLQELADLQEQVNLLQLENEQLEQDKAVLYESLCSQTEKLEECRAQIIKLRQLLIDQYSSSTPIPGPSSGSPYLSHSTHSPVALLTECNSKSSPHKVSITVGAHPTTSLEDGKERSESSSSIHRIHVTHPYDVRQDSNRHLEEQTTQNEILVAHERIAFLENTVESLTSERDELNSQLTDLEKKLNLARQEVASFKKQLEQFSRRDVTDSDMSQPRDRTNAIENSERLLLELRREKQLLEMKVSQLEQANLNVQSDLNSFKEEVIASRDQLLVLRNNSKKTKDDYEYKIASLEREKMDLLKRVTFLEDTAHQAEVICQRQADERRDLKVSFNDLQIKVGHLSEELAKTCRELDESKRDRVAEQEEWKSFQNDLLTTVRVANEFKMDAMEQSERIANRNRFLEDKVTRLENELSRLKSSPGHASNGVLGGVSDKSTSSLDSFASALQNQSTPTASTSLSSSSTPTSHATPISTRSSHSNAEGLVRGLEYFSTPTGRPSIARWVDQRTTTHMSVKALIDTIEGGSTASPSDMAKAISNQNDILHSTPGNNTPFRPHQLQPHFSASTGSPTPNGPGSPSLVTFRKPDPVMPLPKTATRSFSCPVGQSGPNRVPVAEVAPTTSSNCTSSSLQQQAHSSNSDNVMTSPLHGKTMLAHKFDSLRRNSIGDLSDKKDPLTNLVRTGGSKRNALLKWCQSKTIGYRSIDITNFSSSWNDGLAFCALIHTYLPDRVPYDSLDSSDKRRNFSIAFKAAESVGIATTLNIDDLVVQERPDWHQIMAYVTGIYKHFEN